MSRHEGVSCDSCLKGNFAGKRYKCLVCFDYDLCAACYEAGAVSTRHSADHPMQCILTRADFDLFYGGESVSSDQHQSYTCPHCGRMGFTDLLLLEHVSSEHADASAEVVCPVCAAYPGGEPNHVIDDLAAHLMLEHRSSNNDLDVQLSGMRAVRRIPHHGRTVANPRTRRAANMQYQTSPGSTLMVLSPGDRDREAMDPIAELLSQLSSVRSRTAAAQSISSQLQQLEMQLHSTRTSSDVAEIQLVLTVSGGHGGSRLQADRLTTAQTTDATGRSVTTISLPPVIESASAAAAAAMVSGASADSNRDRAAFLLARQLLSVQQCQLRLEEASSSEDDQQAVESERADKSVFVQELLLALLTNQHTADDIEETPAEPAKVVASPATESVPPSPLPSSVPPVPPRTVTESSVSVERTVAPAVVRSGRTNVTTASSVSSVDGRILPNATSLQSRAVTKRKPVPASSRAGKESAATANTAKRH